MMHPRHTRALHHLIPVSTNYPWIRQAYPLSVNLQGAQCKLFTLTGSTPGRWPDAPADSKDASDSGAPADAGRADSSGGSAWATARAVAPLALSLGSSVGGSVMLFPLFTVVRSSGRLGCMLPQALFAARMLADVLSRIAARLRLPPLPVVQVRPPPSYRPVYVECSTLTPMHDHHACLPPPSAPPPPPA